MAAAAVRMVVVPLPATTLGGGGGEHGDDGGVGCGGGGGIDVGKRPRRTLSRSRRKKITLRNKSLHTFRFPSIWRRQPDRQTDRQTDRGSQWTHRDGRVHALTWCSEACVQPPSAVSGWEDLHGGGR